MNLDVYNVVVNIIGELPLELHFIYGVGTIFLYFVIILCVASPFLFLFSLMRR